MHITPPPPPPIVYCLCLFAFQWLSFSCSLTPTPQFSHPTPSHPSCCGVLCEWRSALCFSATSRTRRTRITSSCSTWWRSCWCTKWVHDIPCAKPCATPSSESSTKRISCDAIVATPLPANAARTAWVADGEPVWRPSPSPCPPIATSASLTPLLCREAWRERNEASSSTISLCSVDLGCWFFGSYVIFPDFHFPAPFGHVGYWPAQIME